MMEKSQFEYSSQDLYNFQLTDLEIAKVIAAIVLLERDHPGLLTHVLRIMALAAEGFHMTSSTSNPSLALKCQKELEEWLIN